MVVLLFAGTKRNFNKKSYILLHLAFYIEKRLPYRMLNLKRLQICVTLCKRCLQMKSRTSVVKKRDLIYVNRLTNFSIGFINLAVVDRPDQFFFAMIIE